MRLELSRAAVFSYGSVHQQRGQSPKRAESWTDEEVKELPGGTEEVEMERKQERRKRKHGAGKDLGEGLDEVVPEGVKKPVWQAAPGSLAGHGPRREEARSRCRRGLGGYRVACYIYAYYPRGIKRNRMDEMRVISMTKVRRGRRRAGQKVLQQRKRKQKQKQKQGIAAQRPSCSESQPSGSNRSSSSS